MVYESIYTPASLPTANPDWPSSSTIIDSQTQKQAGIEHPARFSIAELEALLKGASFSSLDSIKSRINLNFPHPSFAVEELLRRVPRFPDSPTSPPLINLVAPGQEPDKGEYVDRGWAAAIKFWLRKSLKTKQEAFYLKALNEWNAKADAFLEASTKNRSIADKHAVTVAVWQAAKNKWDFGVERYRESLERCRSDWLNKKQQFDSAKKSDKNKVLELLNSYQSGSGEAIAELTRLTLLASRYPASFPRSIQTAFDAKSRILLCEIALPNLRDAEIFEDHSARSPSSRIKRISDLKRTKVSHAAYCAIVVRSLYEVIAADPIGTIEGVAVNGQMTFIDRANGRQRTETVASAYALRASIEVLDLGNIDPVVCFRALKGLIGPPSDIFTAVQPQMRLNMEDRRIVDGRDVIGGMAQQTNLAAMEWEDFEHLVRQLFEKEFAASTGAEVKVTRASRDYGVDAIVFDPDPIRGGKYVIQAKCYTIPVGVAAVRDLYGTLVNEGAVKGLLVTTSHFGPDSYEFAKDKPITLIDGSNLLALFKRHGFEFSIDIQAARALGKP